MDITIRQQHVNHSKQDTNVHLPQTSYLLDIGHVKIYGLEKEGPQNHLLLIDEVNINFMDPYKKQSIKQRVKRDQKKYDSIPFKNKDIDTLSGKNRVINKAKRKVGQPGAAGTTFVTKKPVTKA